ncbi:MAG: serine hydrolase [Pseudomonadales bacterium]|jgi:D-alanyl-D-alanine carboxypeptidase (penicillin-binding protein 5/6)|nr:serine hydrolase [Pseudomonadales bacterium]
MAKGWWAANVVLTLVVIALAVINLNQHFFNYPALAYQLFHSAEEQYGDVTLLEVAPFPVLIESAESPPNVNAVAAVAIDMNHKTILFSKNEREVFYPASTTKMVTALVAMDVFELDDVIAIAHDDIAFGNGLGFAVGEQLTVDSLIKANLIRSSNESSLALANHSPYGYRDFMNRMNDLVTTLGLTESFFTNPVGFDDPGQRSSAFDLAILAKELLRNDYLAEIVGMAEYSFYNVEQTRSRTIRNTNLFLFDQNLPFEVFGVKTGTTRLANEVLVTGVESEGNRFLIVVLGSNDRYNDTRIIANYVIDNFSWQNW